MSEQRVTDVGLEGLRERIEAFGDLYDEAQTLDEPSPEYDEWQRRAATALGRLIPLAFRVLDIGDRLAAVNRADEGDSQLRAAAQLVLDDHPFADMPNWLALRAALASSDRADPAPPVTVEDIEHALPYADFDRLPGEGLVQWRRRSRPAAPDEPEGGR